jgi:hypothetical protein
MSNSKHSFNAKLMLSSALEDAVLRDSMLVNEILSLNNKAAKVELKKQFNLDDEIGNTIVERNLGIALFEASTLVNEGAKSAQDVKDLSMATKHKSGVNIVKLMVMKYSLLLEIFARKASAHTHKELFEALNVSRRTATTLKQVLSVNFEPIKQEIDKNRTPLTKPQKELRLHHLDSNFEKVGSQIDINSPYFLVEAAYKSADLCGLYFNEVNSSFIQKTFTLVEQYKQGNH